MTRARILAVSQILIGLLFTNLVVILGPVYLLAGTALLIIGGLVTMVWPVSRVGQISTLAGAITLGGWSVFVVFFLQLRPPLLFVVIPLAVASILMAFYQPQLASRSTTRTQ